MKRMSGEMAAGRDKIPSHAVKTFPTPISFSEEKERKYFLKKAGSWQHNPRSWI